MSMFELTVTVGTEVRAKLANEDGRIGQIKLEPLRRETLEIFEDWLSQGKISRRRELEVLGTHLYKVLADDVVDSYFEKCLDNARKARERLIVRLSFTDKAADLSDLPWEYLYYPDTEYRKGFFLCTHVDLVLSRYVQLGENPQNPMPEESPLRVLLVVSNPEDVVSNPEDKALVQASADQVIKVFQDLSSIIKYDYLDKPTVDKFIDKLKEPGTHVLHFIGHGQYKKDKDRKEAKIALLAADEKSARWVGDSEFAEYFEQMHSTLHLVLLHLCERKTKVNQDTFTANFALLAPELMRVNIPAVVAMRHPIKDEAAIAFSRAFYRELATGKSIDAAVQTGRWRITTGMPKAYDDRVFGSPVLYMRSHGGIIRPVEQTSSTQPKPEETAPKPPKVLSMTSDIPINPPSRITQDVPIQSTVSPSSSEDAVSIFEPIQAKSVSNDPIKTDSNQVFRFNFVKTIISAGENKMTAMHYLTAEQKDQISFSTIHDQLFAEENPDNMMGILRSYYSGSVDRDIQKVIWSMIEALNFMIEA